MREIKLTRGHVAIVDDEDFDELSKFKWHAMPSRHYVYAARSEKVPGGRVLHHKMHRQLKGFPEGMVDHANGNTLDNRRSNLRVCERGQNVANQKCKPGRLKGVTAWGAKWRSRIGAGGAPKSHIGVFESPIAAAIAYDQAARAKYGAFAKLNFPFGAG